MRLEVLACDKCEAWCVPEDGGVSAVEMALAFGWLLKDGKHICSTCRANEKEDEE